MKHRHMLALALALAGGAVVIRPVEAQEPPKEEKKDEKKEEKVKYDRNRIIREEIVDKASDAKTAYDIVQRLRPQFLRMRPSGSIRNRTPVAVKVYVNGALIGGADNLRNIIAESVQLIEYLNGQDATTRFGTDHESGAIMVRTGAR